MIYKIAASLYIFTTILFSHYPWGTKHNKLAAGFLFVVVIVKRLRSKANLIEFSTQHIIFICWVMFATVAGIMSGSGQDALESLKRVSIIFFATLPLYMLIVDFKCFKWVSWTLVIAAIASSVLVNLGLLPTPPGLSPRFVGTLGNANRFAFVSLIGLANLTYLWRVYSGRLIKILILLAGGLLSYQIILSGSRKGMIGVFLILLLQYVFFVFKNRKAEVFKRLIGGLVVLSLFFGIFGYFILKSDYGYRMHNILLYLKGQRVQKGDSSITGRAYLYKVGLKNFLNSPIIGNGLSSFDDTDLGIGKISRRIGAYAHSNLIEVLASSGVIGLILYYSIYWTCISRLLYQFKFGLNTHLKSIWYLALTFIVVMMTYELFSVTYHGKEFWIFLSCVLASIKIINTSIAFTK
jgi:O-antigen ligase